MDLIPYGRQDICDDDIDAVVAILKSDFLTQGPTVPAFEDAVKAHTGAAHALAMNSATSALHVACLALGLSEGDWLWTSPISFVASANCGLYCGANVDFVDIDPVTSNISPDRLEEQLYKADRDRRLPKIVVAVHMGGHSCDMKRLSELSARYGFALIEDASHAIGATYDGGPVGNCRYSDVTVFSFHPVKIVTTGEGGMALTQNSNVAQRMNLLRSHGITRDPALFSNAPDGPWYYEQIDLGFNYRMTDLQAGLGISQMTRLRQFVDRRNKIADRYDELLAPLPLKRPHRSSRDVSAFHLYIVRIDSNRVHSTHRAIFELLRSNGILVNLHYIPIYRQPYYSAMGFDPTDYPESEAYYREAISLPMFAAMTDEQQDVVYGVLHEVLA